MQAQPVSEYAYKLDNGISVKTDHCWNQVWIQQTYAPIAATDKTSLAVNIRTLGDLTTTPSFTLLSKGKEVKMLGVAPGTYDLKMKFKLSGKPGTLSFVVGNILIKPKTKTSVSVILYDYQILISETPAKSPGLASFETSVERYKSTVQDNYIALPTFYPKGNHDKAIAPDESTTKTKGKIKTGTYDLLLTIGVASQAHKIWLENFQMKSDIDYKIAVNLNAGGITYTGINRDVKALRFYPAGTSAQQTGTPAPVKNLEIISYDNVSTINSCRPGTYDVLLDLGKKFEWKKGIAVATGSKVEVK